MVPLRRPVPHRSLPLVGRDRVGSSQIKDPYPTPPPQGGREPAVLVTQPVLHFIAIAVALLIWCIAPPAHAQPAAEFYRGKTITMLCGIGVGGEFDLLTRLLGRHIVHHIPGNPTAVTQN